ncbi:hypothetical protein [Runella sp.]|uniref:hypothetical protein n=1 Tax=Runella sp. TaxID=1960881 RepID=UPI003D0BFF5C
MFQLNEIVSVLGLKIVKIIGFEGTKPIGIDWRGRQCMIQSSNHCAELPNFDFDSHVIQLQEQRKARIVDAGS